MKKVILMLALATIALSACGKTASVSTNAQVKQGTTAAQAIVQGCVSHANFITHHGRKAFVNCLAPNNPAQRAKFQTCSTSALSKDGFLSKSARKQLVADLEICVEKDR